MISEKKNQILTQSQQRPLQNLLPEELPQPPRLQPPQLQEDHTSVEQPGTHCKCETVTILVFSPESVLAVLSRHFSY